MIRDSLKWMFLIIGTTVGAGYASGRELWQFFGDESNLAICMFVFFFSFSCYVIMSISYSRKSTHYLPVLSDIIGQKLSRIYDLLMFLYLFTTTIVMLAGSGATGETFSVSYWWGIIFIVISLILLFVKGIQGLLVINQIMIPLLLIGLMFILISFTIDQNLSLFSHWGKQGNWYAAFPFTALNILPLIAVLGAVGHKIKTKKEILISCIGSGIVFGIVSYIYNNSLIYIAEDLLLYEIPLFAILKNYSFKMMLLMTILLWFAIYTTAASGILGIVTRLRKHTTMPMWLLVTLILCMMIPFTSIGFSTLIKYLYPLYGILNLYVLTRLLLFPFWKQQE